MNLDSGSGQADLDGAYSKIDRVKEPHDGAVLSWRETAANFGGSLDHPAMFASINKLGSVILEAGGNQLTATFIDDANAVQDYFTIAKGPDDLPPTVSTVDALNDTTLAISYSETMEESTATTVANYAVDQGIAVLSAVLSGDQRVVTLTTTQLRQRRSTR